MTTPTITRDGRVHAASAGPTGPTTRCGLTETTYPAGTSPIDCTTCLAEAGNRLLSEEEAATRGLPRTGCCCTEHTHTWYQRTATAPGGTGPDGQPVPPGSVWLECNHCGDTRPLAPPATDADCTLIGSGDGSVMVYCKPCRSCLAPRATTLNAALGFWEEHTDEAHAPAPEAWSPPPGEDPWQQGPVPEPPF